METAHERFVRVFPDLACLIFETSAFPPGCVNFWLWDRDTHLDDECQDLRLTADWEGSWIRTYEMRIKLISALRLTCRHIRLAVDPFFIAQLWFTYPTQIHAFLKAFPASHPLLATARHLRVDIPLAINLGWREIPYTANGWPHDRTYDLYWPPPPDSRCAVYGILECQTWYRRLLGRLTHVISFDNGLSNAAGVSAHPPPPNYLRTLLVGNVENLTSLLIKSPIFNMDLVSALHQLHQLEDLVIHFMNQRTPACIIPNPLPTITFRSLRRLHVAGHTHIEPLLFVRWWFLPKLGLFSCWSSSSPDPFLAQALQKFGIHLTRLILRGKYTLQASLPLSSLCPCLEVLEFVFSEFTPIILHHDNVHTITVHHCDLLPLPSPAMDRFRSQMDKLASTHNKWPSLHRIVDTSWPARAFSHDPAGYMTWWETKERLAGLSCCGFMVLDTYGGEMRGDMCSEGIEG
ncbi:hypothetical protein M422DRAFT_780859 [Sphaerobolus stellatus SS14]|uniref:F-box domain-containing protein n=1 Tax=Sphaerobolus stellatus (strain SS14) TaxID=990650 RepID=A0A0C9VF68_SPHS4|nr:hypothetical protein M422DRAFT_780859 [Sphaerobolus stellatus SS14]